MGLFSRKKDMEDNNTIEIACPVDGDVLPIDQTPDTLFAKKAMGDGVMIKPKSGTVYSPCNGVIEALFPTKHAIGLRLDDGSSLLIHFGLDTVNLKGKGFDVFVKQGAKVKKGKRLLEVDLDYIRANATDDCVVVAISEMKPGKEVYKEYGMFKNGSTIITIK